MFYCGGGSSTSAYPSTATSADSRHGSVTKQPDGDRRLRGARPDGAATRRPMGHVLHGTSEPDGGNHIVAAAESDDLTRSSGRHRVRDPMTGTMAGPTESPFVCDRDGTLPADRSRLRGTGSVQAGDRALRPRRVPPHPGDRKRRPPVVRPRRSGRDDRRPCRRGRPRRDGRLVGEPLRLGPGRRVPRSPHVDNRGRLGRWRRSMTSLRSRPASPTSWSCPRSEKGAHPVLPRQRRGDAPPDNPRPGARLRDLRTGQAPQPPRTSAADRHGALGWEWMTAEGEAELIGPDDPHPEVDAERLRLLLPEVFTAAGGSHDDWDEYDHAMAREPRTVVLMPPDASTRTQAAEVPPRLTPHGTSGVRASTSRRVPPMRVVVLGAGFGGFGAHDATVRRVRRPTSTSC